MTNHLQENLTLLKNHNRKLYETTRLKVLSDDSIKKLLSEFPLKNHEESLSEMDPEKMISFLSKLRLMKQVNLILSNHDNIELKFIK